MGDIARTTPLQDLVASAVMSYLRRADDHGMALQVTPIVGDGNESLPRFIVTGLITGEQLVVEINRAESE